MSKSSNPVLRALGRWETKDLISPEVAGALREEVEGELEGESQRWAQFILAATGGAILIIAGATFLAWVWPEMGYASQSLTLGVIGILVLGAGVRLLGPPRLIPVAYLLQISAPVLIIMALAYSENAWPDQTFGGVVAGVMSLALPLVIVGLALRKDPVLGALQAVFSFLFLFLFLDRALGLDMRTSLWVLDGVGLLGLGWLGYRLRNPQGPEWTLDTFLALLYASLILIFISGEVLWDLESFIIIPADVWLLTVAGISVWALQEGVPVHLQRDWYERQLAYCIVLAIPFTFMTTLEAMKAGPTTSALTVAAIGGAGLWYSIPRGMRWVLATSCLALLIAAWYYGAEKAGALGAVLALFGMSVILFWGSFKLGGLRSTPPKAMD
jgi:hypothetical protein